LGRIDRLLKGRAATAAKAIAKRALTASGAMGLALRARRSNPMILMYHGVTAQPAGGLRNTEGKHVGVDRFAAQLRFLARYRRVLSLTDFVDGVLAGRDMRDAVTLTFDDGYENNVTCAAPVLSDCKLPASFFLATGYIGVDRWMWVDRLESALDRAGGKDAVEVSGLGRVSLGDRPAALKTIKAYAKKQPDERVQEVVAEVARQCDAGDAPPDGDYRFMTWDQARQLKAAGFEVGAHTVNHPLLARVPLERGEREMLDSRDHIARELGACCDVFCYPNGKAGDYTPEIMTSAARHFRAALATNRGPARANERYELRRIGVGQGTTEDVLALSLLRER
jgi:peptidoglycan/xylan/chitin deacetylase (PgdA/CDA1 family)